MQELTFAKWIAEVDRVFVRVCGLSHDDVEDQDWRGLYQTGNTPEEAAKYTFERMAENGYPDISEAV